MSCRLFLSWFLLSAIATSAASVHRYVTIDAPATVPAGAEVTLTLAAGTDAGRGEQVGFFQADASMDGGRTWTPLVYLDQAGTATTQTRTLRAGEAGSTLRVRLRVAFRGGLAGDVDLQGAAIRWHESWDDWREPPAISAAVRVTGS